MADKDSNKRKIKPIIRLLSKTFPDARIPLDFSNPLELLVATILAAQATDVKVNEVTKSLFKKYPSAEAYAEAPLEELERDVKPTGFYKNKAKAVQRCCQEILSRFGGKVPDTIEELLILPGVGRKTANVVLGNAFGVPGIVVDRHAMRVSQRIGLTENSDPVKIERDLMEIVPKKEWTHFSILFTWHGRTICLARNPLCETCPVLMYCDFGLQRVPGATPAEI